VLKKKLEKIQARQLLSREIGASQIEQAFLSCFQTDQLSLLVM
jgi:hypothetical protein